MDITTVKDFFFWCMILNLCFYLITVISFLTMRNFMARMHKSLFGIEEDVMTRFVYGYIGAYKLLFIVFNFVPWLALSILA